MFDELKGGIVFVRDEKRLMGLTVLAFAMTFLAVPLLTFLPLIARNVFKEGVGQYSEMMAFSGTGAVAGALVVAWLGKFRHMGLTALLVQLIVGSLIVAFALTRVLWVTHLLLLVTGAAMIVSMSLVTSLAQLIAPDEMRGRVMSIYMVAFRGGMPLGSLMSGKIADMTSAPTALVINGILLTAWRATSSSAATACGRCERPSVLAPRRSGGRTGAEAGSGRPLAGPLRLGLAALPLRPSAAPGAASRSARSALAFSCCSGVSTL